LQSRLLQSRLAKQAFQDYENLKCWHAILKREEFNELQSRLAKQAFQAESTFQSYRKTNSTHATI